MSIPVALNELTDAVSGYGFAYLLTVSDDGRPHAVAVTPTVVDDSFVADVGRRTRANAMARTAVSLLWPPVEDSGYSLIVDATSQLDAAEGFVRLTPTNAVLHRPAPAGAATTSGACGSDCVPITLA